MKLHLPKGLFTAVMALFAVSQTTWAGTWEENTYYVLNGDSITTLSTADNADETNGAFIRAGADSVTATITELNHIAGKKLTISGTWDNATGTQEGQGYDLANLTITTLNIKDGNGAYGSAALEIGTIMEESEDAVPEMQYVTIGTIKGTISSLNVGKHGSLTLNTLGYHNGTANVNSFADNATVTVNGILDLTGVPQLVDNADNTVDVQVMKLMNSASGAGTIKLKAGSVVHTTSDKTAVVLNTNYFVEGDLTLTSYHDNSSWRTWTVGENGSITASGTLSFLAGQKLVINNGGEVTAGTLALGHITASSEGNKYPGAVEMSGKDAKLTVGTIRIQNNGVSSKKNAVSLTGGTLKITGDTAITYSHSDGVLADVLIGGSGEESLILQTGDNNWSLSKSTTDGSTLTIGNITIDAANTKMITITDAILTGKITNNATADDAGLTLSGAFTTMGDFITASQEGNTTTGFSSVVKLTGLGTSEHTHLADGITFDGLGLGEDGWQLGTDGYYYRTTATSNIYHVYSGTINVNDIGTSTVGDTFIGYEVHSGATLNMNGQDTERLTIYLQDNATLANSGSNINDQHQQLKEITLKGDATVNAGGQFGIVASGYGQGKLDLAGHTLTKTGSNTFLLINTEITGGTLDITQGTVKIIDKNFTGAGTMSFDEALKVKVAQGAILNIAGDKTTELAADFILSATGAGVIDINHKNVTIGNGNSTFSGKVIVESGALTLNGTTLGNLEVTGGTLNVNNGSTITKAYLQGAGQMNITDAIVKNLRVDSNGTVNITGTQTSIGVAGDTYEGKSAGLYAKGGEINIGNGSENSVVKVTRLEFGDVPENGTPNGGTLNVKKNATLIVTGNNNTNNYTQASILFGEWTKGSTLNVDGNFYAKNAKAMVGDTSFTINIKNGGVAAVQGVAIASVKTEKTQLTQLNLEDGGKLILGSDGINCGQKGFTGVMGAGMVGISANTVTIAENIALSSTTGTTFDTTQYVWAEDGSSIEQGTAGGTLTISGAISDHSVTTGEGDAATTTTSNGKLIVTGKGKVVISSSNNTYSGGTEVKGGATLEVAGQTTNALGRGAVDVKEKSTLKLGWTSSLAVDAIHLSGESTIDLSNGSNWAEEHQLNAAITVDGINTIKAGINGNNSAVAGTIQGNGTLNLDNQDQNNTWLLRSTISDKSASEKLAISSDSDVIISGTNTYTGGTTITGRTLTTASEKALGDGKVMVDGGTLKQDGSELKVTALEYKRGTVNNNGQALEVGTLTVGSTTMAMTGSGTTTVTDTLVVSKADAFTMEGALVLTGATVDLSDFSVNTDTAQDTYVYTLGTANGGITATDVSNISFSDFNVEGYTAVLQALAANPAEEAVMMTDGAATNNYLVLTLTKVEESTPLTSITVAEDGHRYADGVLTLKTDVVDATEVVFGDTLNAVMSDEVWDSIKENIIASTLPEFIKVSFADAAGVLLDFGDEGQSPVAITINGEGTRDENWELVTPTLSGDGTVVGNYVTAYIPEPTTTTLSLLALAGLAARRRRATR